MLKSICKQCLVTRGITLVRMRTRTRADKSNTTHRRLNKQFHKLCQVSTRSAKFTVLKHFDTY